MKPVEKWLIDVGAIASPQGWRHPRTNELLKSVKLNVTNITTETEQSQETTVLTPTETDEKSETKVTTELTTGSDKPKKGKVSKTNTAKEQATE